MCICTLQDSGGGGSDDEDDELRPVTGATAQVPFTPRMFATEPTHLHTHVTQHIHTMHTTVLSCKTNIHPYNTNKANIHTYIHTYIFQDAIGSPAAALAGTAAAAATAGDDAQQQIDRDVAKELLVRELEETRALLQEHIIHNTYINIHIHTYIIHYIPHTYIHTYTIHTHTHTHRPRGTTPGPRRQRCSPLAMRRQCHSQWDW